MSDPTSTVHTYIAMWNETDPRRRRELVAETVTDDASPPVAAGVDFATLADDGRMRDITGFLEPAA